MDGRKVVGRFDSYTFPPKRISKSPAKPQKPCGALLYPSLILYIVSLGIWTYRVIFVGILRIWNGRCGIMPFHKPFCGEYRHSFQDFFRYRQRKEIPSRNNPMSFYVKRRFCPILGTTSFRSSGRGLLLWSLPIVWVPSAIGEYGEP